MACTRADFAMAARARVRVGCMITPQQLLHPVRTASATPIHMTGVE
ncbi:hypothetical protein ACWEO2_33535 [Nocardia sp. NPDC004278]